MCTYIPLFRAAMCNLNSALNCTRAEKKSLRWDYHFIYNEWYRTWMENCVYSRIEERKFISCICTMMGLSTLRCLIWCIYMGIYFKQGDLFYCSVGISMYSVKGVLWALEICICSSAINQRKVKIFSIIFDFIGIDNSNMSLSYNKL